MRLTNRQQISALTGILCTGFLGIWALSTVWTLYTDRIPVGSIGVTDEQLQSFGTSYTFRKKLVYQWHWTYVLENDKRWRIEQLCPTLKHDAKLVFDHDNRIAALSDHKIYAYEGSVWNTISKMLIRDGSGNVLYVVRSGNLFQTLVNKNKIWVTLEITDGNDDLLLGYSDSKNWGIAQSISIKRPDGAEEVRLYRTKLSLSEWTWNARVLGSQLNDVKLIAMIIANYAFDDHGSKPHSDLCNGLYFLLCALGIIALLCTLIAALLNAFQCYRQGYILKRD